MTAPLIAVVNDDPGFLAMMSDVLADEGYRTTTSLTTEDALSVIRRDRPDLIILDLHMRTVQGGWDLVQSIRRDPRIARIPIIVCSGDRAFIETKADELSGHGAEALEKPFHINVLIARVEQLVGRADAST